MGVSDASLSTGVEALAFALPRAFPFPLELVRVLGVAGLGEDVEVRPGIPRKGILPRASKYSTLGAIEDAEQSEDVAMALGV